MSIDRWAFLNTCLTFLILAILLGISYLVGINNGPGSSLPQQSPTKIELNEWEPVQHPSNLEAAWNVCMHNLSDSGVAVSQELSDKCSLVLTAMARSRNVKADLVIIQRGLDNPNGHNDKTRTEVHNGGNDSNDSNDSK